MTVYPYNKPKDKEPTGTVLMDLICQPGEMLKRIQQAPSTREIESIRRAAYAVAADGYKVTSERYFDVHQHQLQALETMKSTGFALEALRNNLKGRIVTLTQYMDILLERYQDCQKRGDDDLAQDYYQQLQDIRSISKDFKVDVARCGHEMVRYKEAMRFCEGKAFEIIGPGEDRFKKYQQYNRLADA